MGRPPIRIKHNTPISKLTTFQNEGSVDTLLVLENETDLPSLPTYAPYFVLGKGSNTVINPGGKWRNFIQVSPDYCPPHRHQNTLEVSAGMGVKMLLDLCIGEGLTGMEFSAGVPASVGGMTAMNFGCWGEEMASRVQRVQLWSPDLGTMWLSSSELNYTYRNSQIHQITGAVVLRVVLELVHAPPEEIRTRSHEYIASRAAKQPIRTKTFGSTFKNPTGHFAAALIESTGLKGKIFGGVQISDKHANFLINTGTATFTNIQQCLDTIQKTVYNHTQIPLELEVKLAT